MFFEKKKKKESLVQDQVLSQLDETWPSDLERGDPASSPSSSPRRPAAANAARERSRVQTLRTAFLELQRTLPSVPPDTKLSKLDVLILATTYIAHLTRTLTKQTEALHSLKGEGYLHPVVYFGILQEYYNSHRNKNHAH
uniref:Transcription factor 24 n=1 Tax=Nothobranchius furzeri TaxID=105023 RepID=A0A8C6NNT2_NOTFU